MTILACNFTISNNASAPPPPPPPSSPSITVNGSSNAVVAPGASVAVAVANGPGNPKDWVGLYAAGQPDNSTNFLAWVYLNGTQTAPSTGVKSASVKMTAPNISGSYEARFYANDGFTILARVTFTVQGVGPTAITLSPANATIPDNAPAGTVIATAHVTMADGSQFTGTLATSDTNFFAISGLNIVTARAFTSADDGTHSTVITASQGGQSFSIKFSV